MKRFIVSLSVAAGRYLACGSATVHPPVVARAARRTEEILRDSEFQAGRQIRSRRPQEMGIRRRGRHDAGIARCRQAENGLHRGRHPAPQRGRRNHQCGGHQFLLFRRLHRYVRAVGQGYGAVRRHSHHRFRPSDRYGSLLCRDGRSAWGHGAPASRRTGSGRNSRNTATTTWCRPTTACCATI